MVPPYPSAAKKNQNGKEGRKKCRDVLLKRSLRGGILHYPALETDFGVI